jgi:hypothetical protein
LISNIAEFIVQSTRVLYIWNAYYKITIGQLIQIDALISYSRFDIENECSNMNYLSILNLWVRITLTAMCTPVHAYSIQHYVIKFVSDMWHVGVFSWYWITSKQIRIILYYYFSNFSFSFYYKNIVRPVICEDRHFTHMWKILTWPHLFSSKWKVWSIQIA